MLTMLADQLGKYATGRTEAYQGARAAQGQEDMMTTQMQNQKKMFEARKAAYDAMLARGGEQMGQGENQFLQETGAPLAELGAAKQDVLAGQAEGLNQASGQMAANLSRGGVRGGQAATQMRRGIGQMGTDTQRQINQMALDEAGQRRNMRGGFFANKSASGQRANLAAPAF